MLKTADFKMCAQIQPKRGWCFVRKLFLLVFLCLFPIFSFAITLPSGYTQLEYIESNGTQWIDTGVYGNLDTSFEITCQTTVEPTEDMRFVPFGSRQSATESNIMVLFDVDNVVVADFGDYTATRLSAQVNNIMNKFKIYNSRNSRYIQDVTNNITYNNTNSYNTNFTTPTTLRIAAVGPGFHTLQKNFVGKIWYVKIWNGNILVRDFIPAKRKSDGAVGMYDTVTNTFFENAGSGTFTAGPVVETYTELEYLELQGEAYFNTNVYLSKDMDIEFELMPTQLSNAACFGGARSMIAGYGTGFFFVYNINNGENDTNTLIDFFGVDNQTGRWNIQDNSSNYIMQTNKKYKLSIANKVGTLYADNTIIDTHTFVGSGTSPITVPFYINAHNDGGTVKFANGDWRFYHFSASGAADIVPAQRDSDGELGLYNKTTGEFLEKIGSGTLVAGPGVLPNEYTRLEYIHFDGVGTYIDTGLKWYTNIPTNKAKFVVDAKVYNTNNAYNTIIGNHSGNGLNLAVYTSNHNFWYGNGASANATSSGIVNPETRCLFSYDIINGSLDIYDKENDITVGNITGINATVKTVAMPILLGAQCDMNSPSYVRSERTTMDLYSAQIYNDGVLVRDLIPAKRNSDNAIGLYDAVNNVFYTNSGTGSFVAGPAVDDPGVSEPSCEYTRLEYLKSSDAQYIQDNSFQPISTGAIEIKTKDLRTYTRFAGWNGLVALATPNSVTNYFPFLYGSWDDYNPNPVSIAAENALRYEFEPGLQKLYVNGVFNRQAQKNTSIYSAPFRMFIVSTGGGYNHGSTIYYCRVYDGNNVLLRNYIPVKRNSDNVLGMYDTVTKTFFTNAGTGTFIAGPELAWGNNCSVTISITWGGLAEPDASGMCTYGETFTAPSTAPTAPSGLKFLGWIPR